MSVSTLGLARIVCSKIKALRYAADAVCMLCMVKPGEDIMTLVLTGRLKLQHAWNASSVTPAFVDISVNVEH